MTTLGKIGDLFILSILWLVCCIPIITVIPASAALYYAVVKFIRRERGSSAARDFWAAFRENLSCGVKLSLLYLMFALVTAIWFVFASGFSLDSVQGLLYTAISRMILVAFGFCTAFLIPLFSRFRMKIREYWKYSLFMGFRHFGWTLVMLLGTICVIVLIILLPPLAAVLPALLALALSYVIEPVLARYISVSGDDSVRDIWYDHRDS